MDTFKCWHKIASLVRGVKEPSFGAELEVILHPSQRRLQIAGFFSCFGHLLFWWLWTYVVPQPYENLAMRVLVGFTGLGLLFWKPNQGWHCREMQIYFSVTCWLQFPFFFSWMYLMNGNSSMWMASLAVVIVMYYQLTDWRLATIGLISGALCAFLYADAQFVKITPISPEHAIVFAFSWVCSLLFALSSANLRRERLKHSLTVIGVMAHELRTPLATLSLIAQAIRAESQSNDVKRAERLEELAKRTDSLTRHINHHIDLQISNARYNRNPMGKDLILASQLVSDVVSEYPFSSKRERSCVQIVSHQDFVFQGSSRQFSQVLNNMIKNALHSLKAAQSRYHLGDLRIELGKRGDVGRIQITDNGVGIETRQIKMIFEPFFSTTNDTGHGLGLAFCKQVIEGANGSIFVHSAPAMGATFTIQLPVYKQPFHDTVVTHEIAPLSSA
jgi:two-component system, CAI-1 autoinducer sensor kinase/phosphatase CqsS